MKTYRKINVLNACLVLATTVALSSCSSIDDDRDDCEVDFQGRYRLHLITNEEQEIKRVLGDSLNGIATDLREHLKDVFTDIGSDIGLDFYALPDSIRTMPLRGTLPTEMNASERSFEIVMPIHDYMHLATANVQKNGPVQLQNQDNCHGAKLALSNIADDNSVASQRAGLFSGRQLFKGLTYGPKLFNQNLYIVNCADAIVLDPRTAQYTKVEVYTSGFANSFSVCDSTFHYETQPAVRSERVDLHDTNWLAFCSVNLPSREPSNTRLRVDTDQPFLYADCGEDIWYYDCRVTKDDGSITRTILSIRHPLRAGQLKIITGFIDDQGVVRINDAEVGSSVDLKWEDSYVFEPIFK